MDKTEHDYSKIKELLKGGRKRIVIISHHNPDGDAIGASLGLANLLKKIGHPVDVLVPNRFPAFLNWMKNADKVVVYSDDKNKLTAIDVLNEYVSISKSYSDINFTLGFFLLT